MRTEYDVLIHHTSLILKKDPMKVCVFGSSSKNTRKEFVDSSHELGKLLAVRGFLCVNGGGQYGCMGGLNDGCLTHHGTVKGVIHEKFCVDHGDHKKIMDMEVTTGCNLDERKIRLMENGDVIIVLPGGVGTFDEFWDAVSCKALKMKGLTNKPICIVNLSNYYDGFVLQLRTAHAHGLLYKTVEEYFYVAVSVTEALDWCTQQYLLEKNREKGKSVSKDINRVTIRSSISTVTALRQLCSRFRIPLTNLGILATGIGIGFIIASTRSKV